MRNFKYVLISPQEVEAIYRCISLAMDHRDNIDWESEEQYWSEWDRMSKNIDLALVATNKLAGYQNV
jgi:hypothetical protein